MHTRTWVVAALLLGCSKKEDKPTTPQPEATAATGGDCTQRAARLERELRELAATRPGFVPIAQGIRAPRASGAQPIEERGWVIAVARDGSMSIQGHRFAKTEHTSVVEDVRSYTDGMFKIALEKFVMEGGAGRDLSIPLYIWADRDAPVQLLAELVTYADPEGPWPPRAGGKAAPSAGDDPPPPEEDAQEAREQAIEQARKAGIVGDKPSPPPRSRVPVRLLVATGDAAPTAAPGLPASEPESTQKLVEQLKAAIGPCDAIVTTMGTASLEGLPAKEADKLVKDLPAGLAACGCRLADEAAFTAGVRTWFGAWAPALAWVEMPALDAKDTRTLGQLLAP